MALRFLVVDDASFIRDLVKKQLRDRLAGCEVYDATNGARAIAQLKKQHVDVILSDWEMPGMSGEEFLRWVRAQEAFAETPFIMVTSRGDREHVVTAIQAGVSDFVTKPFSSDELLKKVLKQLKRIGKSPKDAIRMGTSGKDVAFASIDVLTGGSGSADVVSAGERSPQLDSGSVSALTGNAKPAAAVSRSEPPKPPSKSAKARAQLRFPDATCGCVVRDVSLQALSGLMQRPEKLPTIFDQAAVDIELDDGEVARLNGYLSSIAAGENKMDTGVIKVTVRFVDNDPEKFEMLSKFIARTR